MPKALQNTFMVWHSLFLRETLDRFFGNRCAWAWQIIEPAIHIGIFAGMYYFMRARHIIGADLVVWIVVGMLTFFLFRRTSIQTLHAADCNRAFFAFRQVRPFDVALARGSVEIFSMFLVSVVIFGLCAAIDRQAFPDDPLLFLLVLGGMWIIGLGYGMITSVCMRLVPDTGHLVNMIMMPLYFFSGVIIPVATLVPPSYMKYFMINPLLHGVELSRIAFFKHYHSIDVSLAYLYLWAIALFAVGMALYKLLETRLLTK